MLSIKNMSVVIADKKVIDGLDLEVKAGEVHAIMGLNGCGKSTLLKAIAGSYETSVKGKLEFLNQDMLELDSSARAVLGVFMSFQNPVEIPGVNTTYFLKSAINELRLARGQEPVISPEFMKDLKENIEFLGINKDILKRAINVGFSGGEKKKSEILQMMMLKPKLMMLDEIDSGLDIDALKSVANGINKIRDKDSAVILVTHYNRLLEYVKPDKVHILQDGKIIKSGDFSLAKDLEDKGYEDVLK
ncbi:MAG: Fe-S cluster assembly ATPase SufC [Sulfurimonas sp.]|nr:MAG: Fe-S cluster assembly ATPase SufC [Sulfurimonas sp.]